MRARNLEGRIARLEHFQKPHAGYVLHASEPPTAEQLAEIDRARAEGRRFALMPHPCKTVEEWVALYGRPEVLQ